MNIRIQKTLFPVLFLVLTFVPLKLLFADEVKEKFNGLTLNAQLELADGKQISDGVVLIAHALIQHNGMEIIRTTQQLLKENGFSSLAPNYSLAIDDRHGPYDCMQPHQHTREASLDELGFWLAWLKQKGAKSVVFAGHSTGANEVATYVGTHSDPAVSRVIMITPSTVDHSSFTPAGYRYRYNKDVGEIMVHANKLVDRGHGNEIMKNTDFLFCAGAPVSAKTFVSYYGSGASIRLLPVQLQGLSVPTLIIGATEDKIAPHMLAIIKPYVDNKRIKLVTIDGASHFMRDLFLEEAVDAMVEFLSES